MKERPSNFKISYPSSGGHAITLAIWLIAQPASPDSIFDYLLETGEGKRLVRQDFDRIFDQLVKFELIWKTVGDYYIVTPQGAAVANSAVSPSLRDKRRLFFLNRRRKFEVGV